jgi:hypothetical protein
MWVVRLSLEGSVATQAGVGEWWGMSLKGSVADFADRVSKVVVWLYISVDDVAYLRE